MVEDSRDETAHIHTFTLQQNTRTVLVECVCECVKLKAALMA